MTVELHFQLDFRSGTPIYEQIVEEVRRRIHGGQLKPGDQLPTVRQLALELRVNFNTVARAYRILDEAGMISTQQGRGTYILAPPDADHGERLRQVTLEHLAEDFAQQALRLGYSPRVIREAFEKALLRGLSDESNG
ncbi:transcriptional regulator, GntR family [Anaerolinea thermolimosa]|uniref:Transcriptional regulator, GntR family n=1 Tax=Anaerolinea thermolimosa TaxID=229919 RepID=A0A7U9KNP9_9CHLR|nr:GntR family transcriptional regulator [Anaerolinea thermolimosa]GAP08338.1 transcriptional regulator, GntR family [Anaerolinea thermolimosa]